MINTMFMLFIEIRHIFFSESDSVAVIQSVFQCVVVIDAMLEDPREHGWTGSTRTLAEGRRTALNSTLQDYPFYSFPPPPHSAPPNPLAYKPTPFNDSTAKYWKQLKVSIKRAGIYNQTLFKSKMTKSNENFSNF